MLSLCVIHREPEGSDANISEQSQHFSPRAGRGHHGHWPSWTCARHRIAVLPGLAVCAIASATAKTATSPESSCANSDICLKAHSVGHRMLPPIRPLRLPVLGDTCPIDVYLLAIIHQSEHTEIWQLRSISHRQLAHPSTHRIDSTPGYGRCHRCQVHSRAALDVN
jgi:hypothetical protein